MNKIWTGAIEKKIRGNIILPGDGTYDTVRNSIAAKGSPAIIIQVIDTKDIITALKFGMDNALIISIRSGGHNVAGFSTNTDGLVIDLSLMNAVKLLDRSQNLVRIGTGAKWTDVAKSLHEYGLALSSGDTKTVGVGGLTTGGGIGWMVRKYGLAIDSLVAAEIVTPDGKTIRASEDENPDLFWAIRGGVGNFGIITNFEFIAHPIGKVYFGSVIFTLENVGDLLKGWRDYMKNADEALTTIINILPTFMGNPPAFIITCCYANDDKVAADKAINPIRQLGNVINDGVKEIDYFEVLEDAHIPGDAKIIVSSAFVEEFSDKVIQAILDARQKKSDIILQIRGLGGAMSRVSPKATAFAHRNSEVLILSPTFLPPNATHSEIKTATEPWESIATFGNGAYTGFISTNTKDDVKKIYPKDTYERLAKIKQQYDPKNILNQNFNIKP